VSRFTPEKGLHDLINAFSSLDTPYKLVIREKLSSLLEKDLSVNEREVFLKQIEEKYNWDKIADQTIAVYRKALRKL